MIRFQALGVRFTLPLLTILFPMLASRLGMRGDAGALLAALGIHELAHLAAAKLARVHISEIRLMPFGGSARMENPYRLPARQLVPVAAAGPAANLLLAVLIAAGAHWGLLGSASAAQLMQPNLILFVFNLLPALPLDGGRIAYALLSGVLGEARALKAGIWAGRILAALLISVAVYSGVQGESWNLSLILAAVFIIASEPDERSALFKSRAQRLIDLSAPAESPAPVRLYQADAALPAREALACMRPREHAWFIVTRNGDPQGLADGRSLLLMLLEGDAPDISLGDAPMYMPSPREKSGASKASKPIRFSG